MLDTQKHSFWVLVGFVFICFLIYIRLVPKLYLKWYKTSYNKSHSEVFWSLFLVRVNCCLEVFNLSLSQLYYMYLYQCHKVIVVDYEIVDMRVL